MASGRRALVLAVLLLTASRAAAQTLPWPGEPGAPAQAKPWPNDAPQAGAAAPGRGAPVSGGIPLGSGAGGSPCLAEFTKLRGEVEKNGLAAKAASQKHASREEMSKVITNYAASEAKWVKFTEASVGACGIPPQIADQLKQVHANTEQTKERICTADRAPGVQPTAPGVD
jgi:hypothetical protein